MRVSKKLENAPVERNPKVHGRERASTVSIAKMQSVSVLLADALEKVTDSRSHPLSFDLHIYTQQSQKGKKNVDSREKNDHFKKLGG
uniref:Uncharacterized protein n=1 Tax=Sphaerodactylus townsendi TaxID=933632 RepID=A0ACB8G163_9SAUR